MDAESSARYAFLPGSAPLQIERTEGCFLITPDGRRILDAAGGAIVANIGHGREEVAAVAAEALARTTYVVPPFATPERVRLVERLRASWLPDGLERCVFASGGSEAIDAAVRIARQHFVSRGEPARWKVIGRELSYHGTTLSGLDIGGHVKRRDGFEPWLHDVPKAPACYPLRCALCSGKCTLDCADAFEATIEAAGPETVAAVVIEPVGGSTAGALVPPDGVLRRVAEICRAHGILLIADEVMCGFGRTGERFAIEHDSVRPDLLVAGKGLAGGYAPIVGVFATDAVVAPIAERGDPVMFYTYSAHPASCAVADKVLEILEREDLVARAARQGARLGEGLVRAFGDHPHVAEVRGRGLLQALEFVEDRETHRPFPAATGFTAKVVAAGIEAGVFAYPGGTGAARDVLCLGPPFTIADAEIDWLVGALEKALESALERVRSR